MVQKLGTNGDMISNGRVSYDFQHPARKHALPPIWSPLHMREHTGTLNQYHCSGGQWIGVRQGNNVYFITGCHQGTTSLKQHVRGTVYCGPIVWGTRDTSSHPHLGWRSRESSLCTCGMNR